MLTAIATAVLTFLVTFVGLSLVEGQIHRLTKNKDKSYRLGVWVFAVLLAGYAFLTSLGR